MATDKLQDYEALLESGFAEEQARALVRLVSPSRTDPEVVRRLDRIEQLLEAQSQVLAEHSDVLAEHSQVLNQHSQALERHAQALERHSQVLEQHSQMLAAMLPLVQRIPAIEQELGEVKREVAELKEDVKDLGRRQLVIEERVKMEGRVSRMINATLIALGAIAASLVAAFAR